MLIGLVSAIVDNVPLVAASMGMYNLLQYPADSFLWEFMAYCAGTGGSILIIGSAAGVAAMGLEKIHFFWYVSGSADWPCSATLAARRLHRSVPTVTLKERFSLKREEKRGRGNYPPLFCVSVYFMIDKTRRIY